MSLRADKDFDNLTLEGATRLAQKLEGYWHERGETWVKTWVEELIVHGVRSFQVRSNLSKGNVH